MKRPDLDKKNKSTLLRPRSIGYGVAVISFAWGFISFFLNGLDFSLGWYILLFLFTVTITGCFLFIDSQNTEINGLIDALKTEKSGLLASNFRLAELENNKKYIEFFKQFVRYEQQLLGIQTYNYYVSSSDGYIRIKIEYENGYIEEHRDINAVIQEHYNFRKKDLIELRKAIYKVRLLNDVSDLEKFFFRRAEPVYSNKMTNEDFAILSLAEQELSGHYKMNIGFSDILKNPSKKLSRKRLGIAKAILSYEFLNLSTVFSFTYSGTNSGKDNRYYVSQIVESQTGEKKLYLMIYESDQYIDSDDILELADQIVSSFKGLIKANGLVERSEDLDNKKRSDLHEFLQKIRKNI